jgi:hypothetical protein
MKTYFLLLFSLVLQSQLLFSQENENAVEPMYEAMPPSPPKEKEVKEVFSDDGVYEKYLDGVLVAKGYHVNNLFDGELITYDQYRVSSIIQYKLGKKNGKSIVKHFDGDYDYSGAGNYDEITNYENDCLVGYKYHIQNKADTILKIGPFNEKIKKENTFVLHRKINYSNDEFHGLNIVDVYVLHFKNDVLSSYELKRFYEKNKQLKEVNCVKGHFESGSTSTHFSEIKDENSFYAVLSNSPSYTQTYSTEGKLLSETKKNVTKYLYYHPDYENYFYEAEAGKVKFESFNEKHIKVCESFLLEDGVTFRLRFFTEKNGDLLYEIYSKNQVNSKIVFVADSLKKYYNAGVFTGNDGARYFFDAEGKILKSLTKNEWIYANKQALNGSFILLSKNSSYEKEYQQFDFNGNEVQISLKRSSLEKEVVKERTLAVEKAKVFQKDSMIYLIYLDTINNKYQQEIKVESHKMYLQNNVLYYVFPRTKPLFSNSVDDYLSAIHRDSCDPIALPLLSKNVFDVAHQSFQSIETLQKEDFVLLMNELQTYYERFKALSTNYGYQFNLDYFETTGSEFKKRFLLHKGIEMNVSRSKLQLYMENFGIPEEEIKRYMDVLRF